MGIMDNKNKDDGRSEKQNRRIHAALIVRDEERAIARCLRSLAPLVDEIVVMDTGSRDRTKAVMEELREELLPCRLRVGDFPWINDFSAARNRSLEVSEGDGAEYNLVLDADEYIIPFSDGQAEERTGREALLSFILRMEERYGRQWIGAIGEYFDFSEKEGEEPQSLEFLPRILPAGLRYEGIIHEQIPGGLHCIISPVRSRHDGYIDPKAKAERNLPYLRKSVHGDPTDVYMRYHLASALRDAGLKEEALDHFRYFYAHSALEADTPYIPKGILAYLYTLTELGGEERFSEALDVIRAVEREPAKSALFRESADYWFFLGSFYQKLILSDVKKYIGFLPQIEKSYLHCLEIGESGRTWGAVGTGSFMAEYNLGVWYELSGNMEKAMEYYRRSAEQGDRKAQRRLEGIG